MRLLIGGGGSGGHIFPGLAVAGALRNLLREELELMYMGRAAGVEAAIAADASWSRSLPYPHGRSAADTYSVRPGRCLVLAYGVRAGTPCPAPFPSRCRLRYGWLRQHPGGGRRLDLAIAPLVVFLPDIEPGWAVRSSWRRLATTVCVTHSASIDALARPQDDRHGLSSSRRLPGARSPHGPCAFPS